MMNCEYLKQFHEENWMIINIVNSLAKEIREIKEFGSGNYIGNNTGSTYRYNDVQYNIRLVCTENWVQLKIHDFINFVFSYDVDIRSETFDNVVFHGNSDISAIAFGNVLDKTKFIVQDKNMLGRELSYPIHDEQYFQIQTILDLSPEELYQYFMDINTDQKCCLQLTKEHNSTYDNFLNIATNELVMNEITFKFQLLVKTFRYNMGRRK